MSERPEPNDSPWRVPVTEPRPGALTPEEDDQLYPQDEEDDDEDPE